MPTLPFFKTTMVASPTWSITRAIADHKRLGDYLRGFADRHPVQHRIGGEGNHDQGRQQEETHHLPRARVTG